MPSRVERRAVAEAALHVLAVALLVWAMWHAARRVVTPITEFADTRGLRAALIRWSTVLAPTMVHVHMASVPGATDRDWLAALPGAGTRVTWDHGSVAPIALTAVPLADPSGVTRVRVAAPARATIVVRDPVGVLDSAAAREGGSGITLTAPSPLSNVEATAGGTTARANTLDSLILKRVLVLGRVSWESRFVIDALEERGWRVDAHLALAPRNDIVQGPPQTLDTARYAAVLVLDSSVAPQAPAILEYVHTGGGLVLAGSAGRIAGLRAIAAGGAGAPIRARVITPHDSDAVTIRAALGLLPVTELASNAIPLETRGPVVAVAARRVGAGRVVQVGYDDTWRWRMIAANGASAHRAWWAGVLADVAYAPSVRRMIDVKADPAPVASLADMFGAPSPPTSLHEIRPANRDSSWRAWLFAAIMLSLVLEWTSRRARGAR